MMFLYSLMWRATSFLFVIAFVLMFLAADVVEVVVVLVRVEAEIFSMKLISLLKKLFPELRKRLKCQEMSIVLIVMEQVQSPEAT